MSFTTEQMRAWAPVPHKWVEIARSYKSAPESFSHFDAAKKLMKEARRNDGPGVYCVWNGDALAYIGHSKTMVKRVNSYRNSDFPGNDMTFTGLRCETVEEAAALEAELIEIHKPKQNFRREPKGGQVRGKRRAA